METQWSLVLFAVLSAWGTGTYAVAVVAGAWLGLARQALRPCLIMSAAALVVGALASMTHLTHLDRIFGVLSNPGSGIFVEGLSAGLLVIVIAAYLVASARQARAGALKALATVGLVPAVVLAVAVGTSYLMPSLPAWNTAALPLVSLGTALLLGCLTVLAANALAKGGDGAERAKAAAMLKKLTLVAVAVQAVLLAGYVASVGMAAYQDYSRSAERIVGGDLALLFWGAVVVLGLVVPLAAALAQKRGDTQPAADGQAVALGGGAAIVVGALACVLIAAVAFRVIMFALGTSVISFGF